MNHSTEYTSFCQRFGSIGQALADTLPSFSFDIVGLVAGYIVFGTATPGAQPKHLLTLGLKGVYKGQFTRACHAVACAPNGNVWVSDASGVQVFDDEGRYLSRVPVYGCFTCIAFDTNGQVFLCDTDNDRIVVCGCDDGLFLRTFGTTGQGHGQFKRPFAVAVDGVGWLYITDLHNHRVQVVQRDGCFVKSWDCHAMMEDGSVCEACPYGIALRDNGQVVVSLYQQHRVQVFDTNSRFLLQFGSYGSEAGQFIHPLPMTFDRHDHLLIGDDVNDRVQVFKPDGTFITAFGELHHVYAMCVDREGKIYVGGVDCKVQVFGFMS